LLERPFLVRPRESNDRLVLDSLDSDEDEEDSDRERRKFLLSRGLARSSKVELLEWLREEPDELPVDSLLEELGRRRFLPSRLLTFTSFSVDEEDSEDEEDRDELSLDCELSL
jgi:hypothetical protein